MKILKKIVLLYILTVTVYSYSHATTIDATQCLWDTNFETCLIPSHSKSMILKKATIEKQLYNWKIITSKIDTLFARIWENLNTLRELEKRNSRAKLANKTSKYWSDIEIVLDYLSDRIALQQLNILKDYTIQGIDDMLVLSEYEFNIFLSIQNTEQLKNLTQLLYDDSTIYDENAILKFVVPSIEDRDMKRVEDLQSIYDYLINNYHKKWKLLSSGDFPDNFPSDIIAWYTKNQCNFWYKYQNIVSNSVSSWFRLSTCLEWEFNGSWVYMIDFNYSTSTPGNEPFLYIDKLKSWEPIKDSEISELYATEKNKSKFYSQLIKNKYIEMSFKYRKTSNISYFSFLEYTADKTYWEFEELALIYYNSKEDLYEDLIKEADDTLPKSRNSFRIASLKSLWGVLQVYYIDNNRFPRKEDMKEFAKLYFKSWNLPQDPLEWYSKDGCNYWIKYELWVDNAWKSAYKISTCLENISNSGQSGSQYIVASDNFTSLAPNKSFYINETSSWETIIDSTTSIRGADIDTLEKYINVMDDDVKRILISRMLQKKIKISNQ